jgi:hypothetical protein
MLDLGYFMTLGSGSASAGASSGGGSAQRRARKDSSADGLMTGGALDERDPLPWYASRWFWERVAMYIFIFGGTCVSIAGMAMVVLEATHDKSGADHVGAHGGGASGGSTAAM